MRRLLAAVVAIVALLGACSLADDDTTAADDEETSSTSATAPPATVGGATTSTAAGKPLKLTTPEQAASHLFLAWRAGNRAEARQAADDAAVNELFSHPVNGPEPSFEGCDQQQPGRYNCAYRYAGGAMIFYVDGNASNGFRVSSLDFIAD